MSDFISKEQYEVMEKCYNEQSVELNKSKEELDRYKNYLIARKQIGTEMEKQRQHRCRRFTKVYTVENRDMIMGENKPTRYEAAFLFYVIPFVNYETNLIVTPKGIPMTVKKLISLTGFSRSSLYKIISGLKEKNILFEEKDNGVVYYGINGRYIGDSDIFL